MAITYRGTLDKVGKAMGKRKHEHNMEGHMIPSGELSVAQVLSIIFDKPLQSVTNKLEPIEENEFQRVRAKAMKEKLKVFTLAYFPFTMGGRVWRPMACEIEFENYDGPHDLGGGYRGYIITAPNGATFIAEADSGGFVGPSLKMVRQDIENGDPAVMKQQVEDALRQSKEAEVVDTDEFWRKLKCNV